MGAIFYYEIYCQMHNGQYHKNEVRFWTSKKVEKARLDSFLAICFLYFGFIVQFGVAFVYQIGDAQMLTIKVLSTGSQGNCYLLTLDNETLILDCGLPMKDIKKGLNYNIMGVSGVAVTHSHL